MHRSNKKYVPTTSIEIYHTKAQIAKLLKQKGEYLTDKLSDSCCLGNIENAYIFKDTTDYIVCYQAEGPWNGFISTDTLSFCSDVTIEECLKKNLEKYKEQSQSQENPSPITLVDVSYIEELYTSIKNLPKPKDHYFRDILTYAREVLKKTEYNKFLALYNKVVITYEVPDNYESEDGEQNGLSAYI